MSNTAHTKTKSYIATIKREYNGKDWHILLSKRSSTTPSNKILELGPAFYVYDAWHSPYKIFSRQSRQKYMRLFLVRSVNSRDSFCIPRGSHRYFTSIFREDVYGSFTFFNALNMLNVREADFMLANTINSE